MARPPVLLLLCISASLAATCDLFWQSRQSLGYEIGTQLQVCCNVSSVDVWAFANSSASNFTLGRRVLQQNFVANTDDVWTELQLSICSDRPEATIGYAEAKPGVTCEYKTGQTLIIPPGLVPDPSWHVICYRMEGGCESCRLAALCANDLSAACAQITIIGSASAASNDTINYWVQLGSDYPFAAASRVELTATSQRTKEVVVSKTIPAQAGKKTVVPLPDLSPAEWYVVRRCLVVDLPPSLTTAHSFAADGHRLCTEEAFRTAANSAALTSLLTVVVMLLLLC